MKSRTSSCKAAALRKDLIRFWPVWVGYLICLIVIQFALGGDYMETMEHQSYWYVTNISESIVFMGLVNFAYAFLTAQMLFGDLFQSRMCFGLHSLPLRREHWFGAHVTAGFLFFLIPTAVVAGAVELIILPYTNFVGSWQIPLYWFAGSALQYTFFFGLAVFCAMCSGNRFAMTVVYGILNFFSALVYVLVYQLYVPLLYGVVAQSAVFQLLSPLVQIVSTRFIDCDRTATGGTWLDSAGIEQREFIAGFTVQWDSWIYIGILAVLGLVLLLVARQMYKKRKLECAGDFLAVRWMEPVFQLVFTVLCVAVFHGVFGVLTGVGTDLALPIIVIGLVVGWFAGRMFLERTTRVFRLKNFAGLAVVAVLLAGSLFVTKLDPLNVTGWVPGQNDVTRVSLSMGHRSSFTTEDPGEIEEILRLHALALEERLEVHPDYSDEFYSPDMEDQPAAYISLSYRRPNGWLTSREYYILTTGEAGEIAKKYCSRVEVVVPHTDVDNASDFLHEMQGISYIAVAGQRLDDAYLTEEFLNELAQAILADCETGAMVQTGAYHPEVIFEGGSEAGAVRSIYMDMSGAEFYCYLDIYADCENTLAVLESAGILDTVKAAYR